MPTNQGVHDLYFSSTMKLKIISYGACAIYLRVSSYCLVKFMGVIIKWNVQSIIVLAPPDDWGAQDIQNEFPKGKQTTVPGGGMPGGV